jgi:osmotically-inducible protein OsmY
MMLWIMATIYVTGTGIPAVLATEAQLADQAITDAVEDELAHDPAIAAVNIDVQTRAGMVTLTGTLSNLLAKERASRIAETVKGVRGVANQIVVRPDQDLSDEALRKDVITALKLDPVSDALELEVQVAQGVVTLMGTVQSWQEKQAAAGVVKGIQGVREVVNRIAIRYANARPDEEIRADVVHSLNWDVFVDDTLIDVRVQEGEVHLTGTVGSAAEKRAAIADAGVTGVKEIDASGLEVKYGARNPELRQRKYVTKSDEEIRQAVEDALDLSPRVKAYRMVPEVSDSTVTLRGTVDNLSAKRAAAQVARRIVGVVRVENRLKVRLEETSI